MKTRALIPFLFALHSICGAQQAPDDLFPLVVGQKWSYDFALSYSWTLAKYSQRDTGTVSCQITQKLESTDSTIWRFIQIRDYTQWRWANYTNYGPTHYCDTTTFDLVEMNSGSHRLYLFTPDWRAAFGHTMFPLWKDYPSSVVDSSQFYRFASVDSASGLSLNIAVQGPYSSNRSLRFQKGTGVVTSSGSAYNSNSESWQWRYWNCTFTKTYTGSHLNVPRHISYAGFTNYHSDTTIALISNGTEPTTILGITTSGSLLVASLPMSIVPPVGNIPLTLRHQSPPEGLSSYQVIIASDSPTSPDTIDVTINARTESVLHLSERWFNYDKVWFSQRPFIANLKLTNAGNTPIHIDSLRASSAYVTWQLNQTLLQPGDSTAGRIAYVPNPTDFQTLGGPPYGGTASSHRDSLYIFSNASSSPDMVRFSALVLGSVVRFSTHSLSFTSDVPGTATGLVTISVGGSPATVISRVQPSNPSFRATRKVDLQLMGGGSYNDTILFLPQQGGEHRGFFLYYTHSNLFGTDTIPAVDTVWLYGWANATGPVSPALFALYQNFPNPFSTRTTIACDIFEQTEASLRIYDMIGREVAVLASGSVGQGHYEYVFNSEYCTSGLYLCRLEVPTYTQTIKLLLLR